MLVTVYSQVHRYALQAWDSKFPHHDIWQDSWIDSEKIIIICILFSGNVHYDWYLDHAT